MSDEYDPWLLDAGAGLSVEVQRNGSPRWLTAGELRLNLFPGTALEAGEINVWLRFRSGGTIITYPLLGPASGSRVAAGSDWMVVTGSIRSVGYRLTLRLSPTTTAWSWMLELSNDGVEVQSLDAVCIHDVALARAAEVRSNELYVSQYLDVTPLFHDQHGHLLAVRQNQPKDGRNPWLLFGSARRAVGFATDGLQIHGLRSRSGAAGALLSEDLPSVRLQHEHTVAALQDEAVTLRSGQRHRTAFFAVFHEDHPAASGASDLSIIEDAMAALPQDDVDDTGEGVGAVASIFEPALLLRARALTGPEIAEAYGDQPRHLEQDERGVPLSFFTAADRHVVLQAKEGMVLRPHGHLLRTGAHLVPDAQGLTATSWMAGSQLSYLTQGHASANRLLSTNRGYLGQLRAYGLRMFAEVDDQWQLLDLPSAYEMRPDSCSWNYVFDSGAITVATRAETASHAIRLDCAVTDGPPRRFLLVQHIAVGGDDGLDVGPVNLEVRVSETATDLVIGLEEGSVLAARHPGGSFVISLGGDAADASVGDDSVLFADGHSRGLRYVTAVTRPAGAFSLLAVGRLAAAVETEDSGEMLPEPAGQDFWDDLLSRLTMTPPREPAVARELSRLEHALPWLVRDALVHYLSPRGLEQYTGGAWGTRDVSQGPVELLLGLGRHRQLRELLMLIMSAQSAAGGWPQAFGFLEEDRQFRQEPPHGDVIFWPVLALGRYLQATGDSSLLHETVGYYGDERTDTVLEHALHAVRTFNAAVLPGTKLSAYGHGDWNDSLQPADPRMSEQMTSSWTVTLHHQTLTTLAAGLRAANRTDHVPGLLAMADQVRADFQRHLIVDDTIAGYALFENGIRTRLLVHPDDHETGLRYSILPMIHAILADLLDPAQATRHLQLIRDQLLAPDGARLFDRPPAYRGGPMVHFQRAESATFVGREIGLMYTHAHLRYAEALAHLGEPAALWTALQQVINIEIAQTVPRARPRQANCYTSSSDAVVNDRADFAARYAEVMAGEVDVEAGWRVYSSGAGILVRLVRECLLGVRATPSQLELDPVLPPGLDGVGTVISIDADLDLEITFSVGARGFGPTRVLLEGEELPTTPLHNPYRAAGVAISIGDLHSRVLSAGVVGRPRLEIIVP
ncbi:hypothetical protein GCM10009841_03160 [Microlunatus panaciterrae]|uniref:Cellobiose phosphorylase n=1 Tax=Microlunatus panaciterrae TaxID=400768 RepID=A0ABS2RK36_9ACTN|nr:hypothetical protein [Microlunatus panaciterrae]MBM7799023.1 cellobiose phosphorylase [Microlunatus panaciterrae]